MKIINEQQTTTQEGIVSGATPEKLVVASHNHHATIQERMKFYTGEESSSLQSASLRRIRELQCSNDELQRKTQMLKQEAVKSDDALKLCADIEYCRAMVARNTGEILNVYIQNEKRLARIAELERQNLNLHQEITDTQAAFASVVDSELKTKYAAEYFQAKSTFDKNVAEINMLVSSL